LQGAARDDDPRDDEPRHHVALDGAGGVLGGLRLLEGLHRAAHRGDRVGVGEDHPRPGVGDHPCELAGLRGRVDRYGDRLRPQDREVAGHELDPVAHGDEHPVARHDPGGPEPGRQPADLVLELAPGDPTAARLDDREAVGVLGGGPREQVRDVGRGSGSHGRILPHPSGD
jgi:hypothetical protein